MNTGLTSLDNSLSFNPGDLVVIGGRPGMGKSALARQIAWHVSKTESTGYIDLQNNSMLSHALMMCAQAKVTLEKCGPLGNAHSRNFLKTIQENQDNGIAHIDGSEYQRLVSACSDLQVNAFEFLEPNALNAANEIIGSDPLLDWPALLVIDTIQMFSLGYESWFEIAQMVKKLKAYALDHGTVVVVTSDLSRKVDERIGNCPALKDLADSSALEEVSDKVIFILRREYYDPLDKPGMAELIIAKNRNGSVGRVDLNFRKEFMTFEDYQPYVTNPSDLEDLNNEAFCPFTVKT